MAARKKTNNLQKLLTIFGFLALIFFFLRFDAVVQVVDPQNKMKLGTLASDMFWLLVGAIILTVAILTAISIWSSIALIVVGLGIIAAKAYEIYNRKNPSNAVGG